MRILGSLRGAVSAPCTAPSDTASATIDGLAGHVTAAIAPHRSTERLDGTAFRFPGNCSP
jgi:hypothetical protein